MPITSQEPDGNDAPTINCTWEDGEVVATLRQPFDMLAETTTAAARIEADESVKTSRTEIWLGNLDSNQD